MEHEKCTVYRSYVDSAKLFSKDRAELAEAVLAAVEYALYGIEYEGDNIVAKSTFINSKPLSEASWKFYESGKLGGRPVKEVGNKGGLKRGVKKGGYKGSLERGASMIREKEKEMEKDIEIEEKDIDISSGDASISSSGHGPDAVAQSARKKKDFSKDIRETVDYYNSRIAETGCALVTCKTLSDARAKSVRARLAEHGIDNVRAMIDKACASKFLNYNATNAPVNIDWLFGPKNFPKVLDGNFDDRDRASPQRQTMTPEKSPFPDEYSDEEWSKMSMWEHTDAIHRHFGID